ncbi:Transcriptional regulator, contains XRE-family HTH domain [Palleronia marisminoris]|uniref:HTH-type transcriptional regulator ImmR n=1 Tax=Palleronia marisminoris TaxID=315423 RepID=A0A1Y5RUL2_9RHOB|nr:helix-turn-helix transcriptional regulator [Palleronia marisminoris]SFG50679.1 Transcriptional regulator, contains XRE-family HTH domain [Palleronia marisminoris]SLN24612.1 HTH-type transcriptional regulator ImmR [Palleronia marisminoris]
MSDATEHDWYSDETATFGDRLADARQAVGLTQKEFSRRLGVRLQTLESWENDISEPRANRLQMISGLLNVSLVWLLTGEGEGLSAPVDEVPAEVTQILTEMRQLQSELVRTSEKLGRLEKRLRALKP